MMMLALHDRLVGRPGRALGLARFLDHVRKHDRVWVATGDCRTIRVPAAAVVARGQMDTVFVAARDHAQLRIVRTGKWTDREVELLSGIEPGESIVIGSAEPLRDGQPIALQR